MGKQNQQKGLIKQQQSTSLANLAVGKVAITPIMLTELATELLPKGNADFKAVRQFTPIQSLLDNETASLTDIRETLTLLVMNFSESMNVVRNLNATQAIEIVEMLIDECGDFRIEDYFIMFQLAKRGKIGDIRDRIDIQLVSKLIDEYWTYRNNEGKRLQELEDKEKAQQRMEQKRKALGSGQHTEQVISSDLFVEEMKKLEKAMSDNIDKHTLDEAKQAQVKKEMIYNRMKDIYGFSDNELAAMQNIKIQTFGSKINDTTT